MANSQLILFLCPLIPLAFGNVPIGELFPFGTEVGDSIAPLVDDSFAGPIQLRHPFPFFNVTHRSLFVNNNGAISFVQGVPQYTPVCGALPAHLSMIAPYWADTNTGQGLGGRVFYRESTDPNLRSKAAKEIQAGFPNMWGLSVSSVFIATWHDVPFYGAISCGLIKSSTAPRNTFQAILASDGVRSFVIFYYSNITWTSGTASSGDCKGLNGKPAKAGFDVGDGVTFYEVPGSCTQQILNITRTSNVHAPGKWIFRVDNAFESAACSTETEKIQISPPFVNFFTQLPITIKGPCFNESYTATCVFHDLRNVTRVPATIQVTDKNPEAVCQVPLLYTMRRVQVDLELEFGNSSKVYTGYLFIDEPVEEVEVAVTTDGDLLVLYLTWDPAIYSVETLPEELNLQNHTLELVLLEFDIDSKLWIERDILADNISNNGQARLLIHEKNVTTTVVLLSLRTMKPKVGKRAAGQSTSFLRSAMTRVLPGAALIASASKIAGVGDMLCESWYMNDPGAPTDILPCPPLLEQAQRDERYEADQNRALSIFHPGADFSFRQRTPSPSGAGQQCTYKNGQLLVGPPGGETADMFSPTKDVMGHLVTDVLPWFLCCVYADGEDTCQKYYEKRPSELGTNYAPPRPARANGDPHIVTFDLANYTFNGVGEFWMVKSDPFQMQARMEQYLQPNGDPTPASVFTAFAMRSGNEVIQVQLSSSTGLSIFLDGILIDFGTQGKIRRIQTDKAAIKISADRNETRISFATGFSFVITRFENSLHLLAMASKENEGKIAGLLGVFNGNVSDGLQSSNGTLIPLDSSLQTIHHDFGLTWMTTANESLFTYAHSKNHSTYQNISFLPNFALPDVHALPQSAVHLCEDHFECLFDYATTKNIHFANQTLQFSKNFNSAVDILGQKVSMCPAIKAPIHGRINGTNFFAGAEITFGCYKGHVLEGSDILRCTNDSKWIGEPPSCQKTSGAGTATYQFFVSLMTVILGAVLKVEAAMSDRGL